MHLNRAHIADGHSVILRDDDQLDADGVRGLRALLDRFLDDLAELLSARDLIQCHSSDRIGRVAAGVDGLVAGLCNFRSGGTGHVDVDRLGNGVSLLVSLDLGLNRVANARGQLVESRSLRGSRRRTGIGHLADDINVTALDRGVAVRNVARLGLAAERTAGEEAGNAGVAVFYCNAGCFVIRGRHNAAVERAAAHVDVHVLDRVALRVGDGQAGLAGDNRSAADVDVHLQPGGVLRDRDARTLSGGSAAVGFNDRLRAVTGDNGAAGDVQSARAGLHAGLAAGDGAAGDVDRGKAVAGDRLGIVYAFHSGGHGSAGINVDHRVAGGVGAGHKDVALNRAVNVDYSVIALSVPAMPHDDRPLIRVERRIGRNGQFAVRSVAVVVCKAVYIDGIILDLKRTVCKRQIAANARSIGHGKGVLLGINRDVLSVSDAVQFTGKGRQQLDSSRGAIVGNRRNSRVQRGIADVADLGDVGAGRGDRPLALAGLIRGVALGEPASLLQGDGIAGIHRFFYLHVFSVGNLLIFVIHHGISVKSTAIDLVLTPVGIGNTTAECAAIHKDLTRGFCRRRIRIGGIFQAAPLVACTRIEHLALFAGVTFQSRIGGSAVRHAVNDGDLRVVRRVDRRHVAVASPEIACVDRNGRSGSRSTQAAAFRRRNDSVVRRIVRRVRSVIDHHVTGSDIHDSSVRADVVAVQIESNRLADRNRLVHVSQQLHGVVGIRSSDGSGEGGILCAAVNLSDLGRHWIGEFKPTFFCAVLFERRLFRVIRVYDDAFGQSARRSVYAVPLTGVIHRSTTAPVVVTEVKRKVLPSIMLTIPCGHLQTRKIIAANRNVAFDSSTNAADFKTRNILEIAASYSDVSVCCGEKPKIRLKCAIFEREVFRVLAIESSFTLTAKVAVLQEDFTRRFQKIHTICAVFERHVNKLSAVIYTEALCIASNRYLNCPVVDLQNTGPFGSILANN